MPLFSFQRFLFNFRPFKGATTFRRMTLRRMKNSTIFYLQQFTVLVSVICLAKMPAKMPAPTKMPLKMPTKMLAKMPPKMPRKIPKRMPQIMLAKMLAKMPVAVIVLNMRSKLYQCKQHLMVHRVPKFITRAQCYKKNYVRNLRISVISQSVCPWLAFPAQANVCR